MKKSTIKGIGGMLITTALVPTPDDVTIISPAIQLIVGVTLLILGRDK